MTNATGVRGAVLAAMVALAGLGGAAVWTQAVAAERVVKVPDNVLNAGEIESRLTSQGYRVKEIKIRDLIAKVEAYDSQGREVELVIDRRSGEVLAHEFDD
jgi:hypothetical protein